MPNDSAACLALLEAAMDGLGIYPAKMNGVERTPWQDGWNAALLALVGARCRLDDWFDQLPPETAAAVVELLNSDEAHLLGDPPTLHVNCNDLFAWACADSEPLPLSEAAELAAAYRNDPTGHASGKWACRRRQMQPQRPVVELMKAAGVWDEEMDALPAAPPS